MRRSHCGAPRCTALASVLYALQWKAAAIELPAHLPRWFGGAAHKVQTSALRLVFTACSASINSARQRSGSMVKCCCGVRRLHCRARPRIDHLRLTWCPRLEGAAPCSGACMGCVRMTTTKNRLAIQWGPWQCGMDAADQLVGVADLVRSKWASRGGLCREAVELVRDELVRCVPAAEVFERSPRDAYAVRVEADRVLRPARSASAARTTAQLQRFNVTRWGDAAQSPPAIRHTQIPAVAAQAEAKGPQGALALIFEAWMNSSRGLPAALDEGWAARIGIRKVVADGLFGVDQSAVVVPEGAKPFERSRGLPADEKVWAEHLALKANRQYAPTTALADKYGVSNDTIQRSIRKAKKAAQLATHSNVSVWNFGSAAQAPGSPKAKTKTRA